MDKKLFSTLVFSRHLFQRMRIGVMFVVCLSLLFSISVSRAQVAQSQVYRLGADDVIGIVVQRHQELSVDEITISSSGTIDLPEAGTIVVAGKTTTQVAQAIKRALSKSLVDPDVTVSLKRQRSRRIFVLGAVAKPGVYEIKPGWRVAQALAAAGGVPDRLAETSGTLARASQPVVDVNIESALADPSSRNNLPLQPGDVLVITARDPKQITVSGDVTKPDVYELRRAPRLLDALVAAGGLKQRAQSSRGFVLRKGQRIDLNLSSAVEFQDPTANIQLEAGDLVSVEAVPALRISVDGFVRNPGNFELENGSGVIQAIAQAGGSTVPAEQVVASVRRGNTVLPIDLRQAVLNPGSDIPLQNGDIVLLNEPDVIRVQVSGQVNKPGALRLPPTSTVLDSISRAGGLSIRQDVAHIDILRTLPNGRQIALNSDPIALFNLRDLRQNPRLQDGDLVTVTEEKAQSVYISGEVARPGAYDIRPGDGVPELIARAGGATEQAALTRVTLQRNLATQTVDVRPSLENGGEMPKLPLQEGDFVVVPKNNARVLVLQAVQKPGAYPIPENGVLTVGEAVSLAGGPRDRAAIKEIALFRQFPSGLQRRVIELNKVYDDPSGRQPKQLGLNEVLQNGDIVYVPEGRVGNSSWDAIGRSIGTLTSLRFLGVF